jgi:predicted  nucleic acid-binding Zn-ribbon protein
VKQRRVEGHQRRIKKLDDQLADQQRSIREIQMRIDSLSLDVASREEQINHHRIALTKAKTNKEYAAILAALNTEKADNAKIENQVLQMMEEIQAYKDEEAVIQAEKDKLMGDAQKAENMLQEFEAKSEKQWNEYKSEWDVHAEKIESNALNAFNRVAQRHEGEALAAVEKINPKRDEYLCSGCNMNISLEIVNSLQTRNDIQICASCGRILYISS